MPGHVVGRDAELASIRDFVASISDGAAALVLEGDAGVGKSTLWSAAVEEAETRHLLVLRARPSESEATLSFSGVGDLLDRVIEDALASLPTGQRRALSRALILDEDVGPPPVSRHFPTAPHGPAGLALAPQTSFRNGAPVVRMPTSGMGESRVAGSGNPHSQTRGRMLHRPGDEGVRR